MMNKRNKLDIAPKGLILAVTVIIALILSAIALYMVTRGKSTINDGNAQYTDMMSAYSEINTTLYDGLIVSGDKVIDLVNEVASTSVHVVVITKANQTAGTAIQYPANGDAFVDAPTGTTTPVAYAAANSYNVTDISSAAYINKNATFLGKVHKNSNGVVDGMYFTQQ